MNESELNPNSPEFDDFSAYDDTDEENTPSEQEVPFAVLEAFKKAYPEAVNVKFEEETKNGEPVYEVEFINQGVDIEASYLANGTLIQIEQEIQLEELPEAVTEAIMEAYPDAILIEAEKIMAADGSVRSFEVEIEDDDVELEIHLDPNGTILDSELETETSEAE